MAVRGSWQVFQKLVRESIYLEGALTRAQGRLPAPSSGSC
jgi:hypothetical protein